MEFLVILTAWAILQWQGLSVALQRDHWLVPWHLHAGNALTMLPLPARLALIAGLPALLAAAASWVLSPVLGGVLAFGFALLVLLYSLGRGDVHAEFDSYLERWLRGDLEAAYQEARTAGLDTTPIEDGAGLHAQVRSATLYLALERWFGVVFWFYLLGPGGAVFYRVLQLLRQGGRGGEEEQQWLQRGLEWLDWLPARLLGAAFAVTGNFVGCFRVWRENLLASPPVRELLVVYELQALEGTVAQPGEPQFIERAAAELRELVALLGRSAISWLVLFALLQMVR